MERHIPGPGEKYMDKNGKPYQIVCVAAHTETGEKMVVYQSLCEAFACFVRPLGMFLEEAHKKHPDKPGETEKEAQEESESFSENIWKKEKSAEEGQANPALLEFLDADTLEQKYQIIKSVGSSVTDRLIDDFAVPLYIFIPEGNVETRYQQLLSSVRTMQKFETTRFRPR